METVLRTPTGVHYNWLKQSGNKSASLFSYQVTKNYVLILQRSNPKVNS